MDKGRVGHLGRGDSSRTRYGWTLATRRQVCFFQGDRNLQSAHLSQKACHTNSSQSAANLNAARAELAERQGLLGNGRPVDLLLICCLAISHSRKGAINLIIGYQVDKKPLRQKKPCGTTTESASRSQGSETNSSPKTRTTRCPPKLSKRRSQLLPSVHQIWWKVSCQPRIHPQRLGLLLPDISSSPDRGSDSHILRVSRASSGPPVHLEGARHIHLAHSGSANALSASPLEYLTPLLDTEGRSTFGRYSRLLLLACLCNVQLLLSTVTLLSEFLFKGAPLRNALSSKKCLGRMKADNQLPMDLLSIRFLEFRLLLSRLFNKYFEMILSYQLATSQRQDLERTTLTLQPFKMCEARSISQRI